MEVATTCACGCGGSVRPGRMYVQGHTHKADLSVRIERKIERADSGCWEWRGARCGTGYGNLNVNGRMRQAHRVVYEMVRGPIPDGLHLDHLCRNRGCVNPDHLDLVSSRENTLRSPVALAAINARKTHCPNGHPYDDANTYFWKTKTGLKRHCRICNRAQVAAYLSRKKVER